MYVCVCIGVGVIVGLFLSVRKFLSETVFLQIITYRYLLFEVTIFFFFFFPFCADQELRNVIDKLAQFVARNGPEFEKMTMEKQKDNPKFSFLFGGEYFSYYKCKLAMEQQQRM